MLETTKYVRNPLYVEAVQVTAANFEEVTKWCSGVTVRPTDPSDDAYIRVEVINPMTTRQTQAHVGDWVLKTGTGYKVYNDKAFKGSFNKVEGDVNGNGNETPGKTKTKSGA